MGTNYYWIGSERDDDPCDGESHRGHIGKRAASGPWCHDCDRTLCLDGPEAVHTGWGKWSEDCPGCGAPGPRKQDRSDPDAVHPVRGSCSFSWAVYPEKFWALLEDVRTQPAEMSMQEVADELSSVLLHHQDHQDTNRLLRELREMASRLKGGDPVDPSEPVIENEYGDKFTAAEFRELIEACKITSTKSVGMYFS